MRSVLRIEDKVVAITGAGQGIGRATAMAFAAAGAKVAVIDFNHMYADDTVNKIVSLGGEAMAQAADVSQEIQVKETIAAIVKKWGRLDILVNNAGIYRQGDALNTSTDNWNAVLAVNLTGAFLMFPGISFFDASKRMRDNSECCFRGWFGRDQGAAGV